MDDAEADAAANDIKLLAEGIIVAINEEKFDEIKGYVEKMKKDLEKITLYAERKKVAF